MELRQMKYFLEVCRENNFTRAAANLYVAQPAITNAIRKLEIELEVKLLNRTNKEVSLTSEGRVFLERISPILSAVNEITQEMHDIKDLKRGTLNLGVPPQIGAYMFPGIFTEFGSRYPNLQLNVFEQGSAATTALLEKGELDIGIVILRNPSTLLNTLPIRQEPILLCVSLQHRLAGRKYVDFSELRNEKFILRKTDSFFREIVLELCKKYEVTPNVVFSSNQIQTIKSLVAENVGIAFFMEMVLKNDPSIASIALDGSASLSVGLAWKKGKYVSKVTQAFIDFVVARFLSNKNMENRPKF